MGAKNYTMPAKKLSIGINTYRQNLANMLANNPAVCRGLPDLTCRAIVGASLNQSDLSNARYSQSFHL